MHHTIELPGNKAMAKALEEFRDVLTFYALEAGADLENRVDELRAAFRDVDARHPMPDGVEALEAPMQKRMEVMRARLMAELVAHKLGLI